jgi:hypothetical protein
MRLATGRQPYPPICQQNQKMVVGGDYIMARSIEMKRRLPAVANRIQTAALYLHFSRTFG